LHRTLGVKVGDKLKLMGREFKVHACHEERGSKDDITVWIHLKAAQELLNKKGRINSILALQCLCPIEKQAMVRQEIMTILPGVQVVEMGTKILARAETRLKAGEEAEAALMRVKGERFELRAQKENLVSAISALVLVACVIWVGLLALQNVQSRRGEIGVLRALGLRSRQILGLVLMKALAMALLGGAIGAGGGVAVGRKLGLSLEWAGSGGGAGRAAEAGADVLLIALGAGIVLSLVATWIPAMLAARKDPAVALRGKL
jgi:ABC-type antimicrobial peptide transport system permease subunit